MKYMGSKRRVAKHILPIMLANRTQDQYWVEPFVGGANMIDKVDGKRIGGDTNEYVIALLKALQDGYIPPVDVSREYYYEIKNNREKYPMHLVGFIGFACSFGGKWFGGYAFDSKGTSYVKQGSSALVKQVQSLQGVDFYHSDYRELKIPDNSIIYCDPPYMNTVKYRDKFDSDVFWQWCRDKSQNGHELFVSEYNAPEDFECIKEIPMTSILNKNIQVDRTEKLFKWKN